MGGLGQKIHNLKESFANLPVKSKLMTIILAVSVVCTLLTVLAFSVYGVVNIKRQMKEEIAITGTIISNRVNAALVFNNNSVALETLNALSANSSIQIACVYNQDRRIFAKFFAGQLSSANCPEVKSPAVAFTDNSLVLYKDITDAFDNSIIGTLYIESDLSRVTNFIIKQSYIALGILIFAVLVGFIMARRLQKIISQPLSMLVSQNDNIDKYMQGSDFFSSNNELTKLDALLGSMFKKIAFLEDEVKRRNKELKDVIRNSESTFNYLSNELKQPLESTLAFGDIISSKSIGEIDKEYISYYNDVYLNVFYYYGIINDTMGFYKNHLRSKQQNQVEAHPNEIIEKSLAAVSDDKPEFLENMQFHYNLVGQENLPKMFFDEVIVKEIFSNIAFVFSKYVSFLKEEGMHLTVATKLDDSDQDSSKFKIEVTCKEMIDQDASEMLENHRDYQNDVHLLRAKLQYLKYLTSYNGGYLDYGNDLRNMSKIILLFPIQQMFADDQPMSIENLILNQIGRSS